MAGDGPPVTPCGRRTVAPGHSRSDAARRRFLAAYEHAFAVLWPTPRSEGDVDTEFGTTHFHRFGSRTRVPIVLLHGATSNAVQWYPFVRALGAAHPVIALDTVGDPGRSTARVPIDEPATSAAWLDQTFAGLLTDRAHLIGHSYGSWLALNQAVHAPKRLVSVAALDPGGVEKVSWRFIWLMYLHGLAGLAPAPLRRRLAVWLDNPVLAVPELKKVLLSGALNFRTTRPAPAPPSDEQLRGIDLPTLVIIGERSPLLHPQQAAAHVRLIRNGHVVIARRLDTARDLSRAATSTTGSWPSSTLPRVAHSVAKLSHDVSIPRSSLVATAG